MANITKKGDGKYLVRVSQGTGKNRRWINKLIRGTLKDAKAFAREKELLLDQGYSVEAVSQTFGTYVDFWLDTIPVKKRTKDFYRSVCTYYAKPLNARRLPEITPEHIESLYAEMAAIGLSPNTIRHLHSALRALFNFAIKRQHLSFNPCTLATQPKKKRPEIIFFNENEAARFYRKCQTAKNGLIFEFALESGMRPEEYTALRRSDLNFLYLTASVDRVVCFERKGGGYYFEEPKTKKSRRLVPMSPELADKVRKHLTTHSSDLVFPNSIGTPFNQNNLTNRYLMPIAEAAELKRITLYSLRHTCATLLLMAGENAKVVADRLGHSDVKLTLDTYSHVLPHIQEAATDKLSLILRGAHKMHTQDQNIEFNSDIVQ